MTPTRVLLELEKAAARLGVVVRCEPMEEGAGGGGDLCWVRGQPQVIMDASLPVASRVAVLTRALSRFDLEAVYLPPLVRARIEAVSDRFRVRAAS
jgi:hypothetical protein